MDRVVRNLAIAMFLAYVALLSAAFYWAVPAARALRAHEANKRSLVEERLRERGTIFSSDGAVLARSVASDGTWRRRYPFGSIFAHAVGYASPRYGKTGLERALDSILSPPPGAGFWSLESTISRGTDVRTTLDSRLQETAARLLTRPGAVVALEPATGKIRCLYSYPGFDPEKIDSSFASYAADARKPFVDRAAAGLYTPGSSFKIITLAAYLEHGGSLEDHFRAPAVFKVGGFRVTNYGGTSYGTITVREAFARSVNTVFAQMGLKTGEDALVATARAFGIERDLSFELPFKTGRLPAATADPATLAWTAVGQADLLVSPLEMALAAATIANGGAMPLPTLREDRPVETRRVVSEATAQGVSQAMVDVVRAGTGKRAALPGITVAGKTGTAEVPGGDPHSWFVGFAPADNPRIVVCVIVEHGGLGGQEAARIFREMVRQALGEEGR